MPYIEDHAIVVGISTYPRLSDLAGPENDALEFERWLLDPNGGDLPQGNIHRILSSTYARPFGSVFDAKPSEHEVVTAFDRLHDLAIKNGSEGKGLRVGRRLYLYFAGHGFAPKLDDAALLMANATQERAYHVPGPAWVNLFYDAGFFEEFVLFMDCCREDVRLIPSMPRYNIASNNKDIEKRKRFFGFATKWSRLSREHPDKNSVVRGVFTTALLAGLRGGAAEATGEVTDESLKSYLYQNMKKFLSDADLADPDVPKEPDVEVKGSPQNKLVFGRSAVRTWTVRIAVPGTSIGGKVHVSDGNLTVVASEATAPAQWILKLPRGLYSFCGSDGVEIPFAVDGVGDVDVKP